MKNEQKIYDGGPAFPVIDPLTGVVSKGMSLRDYYAGEAMKAILFNYSKTENTKIAVWSLHMADAMLKEREKM